MVAKDWWDHEGRLQPCVQSLLRKAGLMAGQEDTESLGEHEQEKELLPQQLTSLTSKLPTLKAFLIFPGTHLHILGVLPETYIQGKGMF